MKQVTSNKRYSFLRVNLIIAGIYLFFGILGFILSAVYPIKTSPVEWQKFFSWSALLRQFASFAFSCIFYYFSINEYYRLLTARKPIAAFIKPVILALGSLIAYYLLYTVFLLDKNIIIIINGQKTQPLNSNVLIVSYLIGICFYLGMSFVVAYVTSLIDNKKENKILEEKALELEFEKSQANFNFLKAQINPHFLHNTLNFLYAKSLPYSEELSEGILTLSDIMRYALNEANIKNGKVPLNDELEHLGNVIKINQLRFSNELQVIFETEGNTNNVQIIPFVLITLAENAFKHGDLNQSGYPLTIRLKMDNQQLSFYCSNKKKMGLKELSTGIGLDNIKKRLELTYGTDFSLDINDEQDYYTTNLKIKKL